MTWIDRLRQLFTPRAFCDTTERSRDRDRLAARQAEIRARLERLRLESEQPALRRGYRPPAPRNTIDRS